MRNKIGLIFLGVIIALLLFGWIILVKKARQVFNPIPQKTSVQVASSLLQTILATPLSVSCSFTDSSGKITRVLIKNGKIKALLPGDNSYVLYVGGIVYVWGGKQAIKAKATPDQLEKAGSKMGLNFTNRLSHYKDYCKNAEISDQQFVIPKNITFTDYSSYLQFL